MKLIQKEVVEDLLKLSAILQGNFDEVKEQLKGDIIRHEKQSDDYEYIDVNFYSLAVTIYKTKDGKCKLATNTVEYYPSEEFMPYLKQA